LHRAFITSLSKPIPTGRKAVSFGCLVWIFIQRLFTLRGDK